MTRSRSYPVLALAMLVMLIAAPAARAQDASGFNWSITPYLWASETVVDLTFRDADIGAGEISFNDLLDVLDAAFMIHVEHRYGRRPWWW